MGALQHRMSLDKLEPFYKREVDRIKLGNDIANEIYECKRECVSQRLCYIMREMNRDGMSALDIYDFIDTFSVSEIRNHIEYECEHENKGGINYDQCGWIKYHYQNGMTIEELIDEYDIANEVIIKKHLRNECNHDTGLDPVNL